MIVHRERILLLVFRTPLAVSYELKFKACLCFTCKRVLYISVKNVIYLDSRIKIFLFSHTKLVYSVTLDFTVEKVQFGISFLPKLETKVMESFSRRLTATAYSE